MRQRQTRTSNSDSINAEFDLRALTQQDYRDGFVLFLVALVALLLYLQFPRGYNFDEFHYIPAAKKILTWAEYPNYEHPPLGKFLIAIGLKLWGDVPFGWRFMNALFGAATLPAFHAIARSLFQSRKTAFFATFLTAFNMAFFVQSRIAMLDGFMVFFFLWGVVFLMSALKRETTATPEASWKGWLASGSFFGLATACKWSGAYGLIAAGIWALCKLLPLLQNSDHQEKFKKLLRLGVTLGVVPVLFYFLTFTPFLTFDRIPAWDFFELFEAQRKMWDGQMRVIGSHPYHSAWTTWPWMTRPIWYVFDKEADPAFVRGVLMIGNPLVMWPGLVALALSAWQWISGTQRQRKTAAFIVLFWCILYFMWGLGFRKVSFYYYYYPASLFLSLAIAACFEWAHESLPTRKAKRLLAWTQGFYGLAVLALFIYFLPILAAFKIPADAFRQWMWLRSWI
jgi:dolichyl-phosphate-mannose-protein mannosyltransferase